MYFSAHWCPPCRKFTPVLADFYKKVNENGKQLEIVFVSLDNDPDQFKEYYDQMPWLTLPFKDERSGELSETYECQGIPHLVILNSDSKVVSLNGRDDIESMGVDCLKKWLQ